ncbi:MAG TPA: LCP family protein, partial [Anaerovoracaceae bacterium]|nr:LCP family protein [Anaerovoracaceae bacterium]
MGERARRHSEKKNIFQKIGAWFMSLKGWQRGLFIALIVIVIVGIVAISYVFSKLDILNKVDIDEGNLSIVDMDGYANILLLGVDSRDMDNLQGTRSDAMIVVSINEETRDVKLISVYRDTYLKMGDTSTYDKITHACVYGGPEMTVKSLNQAMDLNISKFVVVNFKAVADLVDAIGGIDIDVKDIEIQQLNKYAKQTANNIGRKSCGIVKKAGLQTLDGCQAVSYSRIRKGVGDDYKRTERMRTVIMAVFDKAKTMSWGKL